MSIYATLNHRIPNILLVLIIIFSLPLINAQMNSSSSSPTIPKIYVPTTPIILNHEAPLSRGWDVFSEPLSSGDMHWTILDNGNLQVSFELTGASPNHRYLAGVHFFDPGGSGQMTGVCQFGGTKIVCDRGPVTREGTTATVLGAWDFGYLDTNGNGYGKAKFTLSPPAGTYYAQFTVRIGDQCDLSIGATSGCSVVYRTGTKLGQGFERITIPSGQATLGSGCDWTGTWDTDFGLMTLQQSGNTVIGSYSYSGGQIQGTISGNNLVGGWTETSSKTGTFDFTMATDCQSFSGKWRYGTVGDWSGDWKGSRKVMGGSATYVPKDIDVYPGESIQKAIDSANPGDTVWVKQGTYYETININKPIFLEGWVNQQDQKSYPVLDASGKGSAITISADGVGVETFKVINSADSGLKVSSNDNIINQIIAENNLHGFYFENAKNNTFETCLSRNNQYGVYMDFSNSNYLNGINADHNDFGLYFKSSNNNKFVYSDDITNNTYGIYLDTSRNNEFEDLWITECNHGIYLISSYNNTIGGNVFCDNEIYNAYDNGLNQYSSNFYGTCDFCKVYNCEENNSYRGKCWPWDGCFSGAPHSGNCDNPYIIPGGQNVDLHPSFYCNHYSGFTSKHKERK